MRVDILSIYYEVVAIHNSTISIRYCGDEYVEVYNLESFSKSILNDLRSGGKATYPKQHTLAFIKKVLYGN